MPDTLEISKDTTEIYISSYNTIVKIIDADDPNYPTSKINKVYLLVTQPNTEKIYTLTFDKPTILTNKIELISAPSPATFIIKNAAFKITSSSNQPIEIIFQSGTPKVKTIALVNCLVLFGNDANNTTVKITISGGLYIINSFFYSASNSNTVLIQTYGDDAHNTSIIGLTSITNKLKIMGKAGNFSLIGAYIQTEQVNEVIINADDFTRIIIRHNIIKAPNSELILLTEANTSESQVAIITDNIFIEQKFPIKNYNGIQNKAVVANNIIRNTTIPSISLYCQELYLPDINLQDHEYQPFIEKSYEDIQQYISNFRSTEKAPPSLAHTKIIMKTIETQTNSISELPLGLNTYEEMHYNQTVGISPVLEYSQEGIALANYPSPDFVRKDVEYAFKINKGTMIVPPQQYVLYGTQYDSIGTPKGKVGLFNIHNYETNIKIRGLDTR